MRITIRQEDFNSMLAHALGERPDEACGLIAGYDREDGVREIDRVWMRNTLY